MISETILQCTALLFDLDGVLVDSAACIENTWRTWALSHDLDPARVLDIAHGRRALEIVRIVAPHLDADAEVAELAAIESAATEGIFEVPSARALLRQLTPGTWAIVTSGTLAVASSRLRLTNLPRPDVLVTAEDVRRSKPDPEGYRTAAERLGVEPAACVVVEDATVGLAAARAAGMRSIGVCGTYDAEALSIASYTIPSLAALRVATGSHGGLLEIRLALEGS